MKKEEERKKARLSWFWYLKLRDDSELISQKPDPALDSTDTQTDKFSGC